MKRNLDGSAVVLLILVFSFFLFHRVGLAGAADLNYPTRAIELYCTTSAGGSTDVAARALVAAASKHLGQPIIVINKTGGSGAIALMGVRTAKPDGYTLGTCGTSSILGLPYSEKAPFKDLEGFTYIVNYGTYIWPLIVRGDAPWKTWSDFVDWARKNPGATKLGITGSKTSDYKGLNLWQIEQREQLKFTYLPFKGSPEILTAILGGHINLYASTIDTTTVSYLNEGKLRMLLYSGLVKVPGYENIPSTRELYGFNIPDLLVINAPAGLPDHVLKKLDDAFAKAVKDDDFKKVMARMYVPVMYEDRPTVTKRVKEEFARTGVLYKKILEEEAREKK